MCQAVRYDRDSPIGSSCPKMGLNLSNSGPIRVCVARKTDKMSELVGSGVPNIPEIACRSYATRGTSTCPACRSYATS